MAGVGPDGGVCVWDTQSGKLLKKGPSTNQNVCGVAFGSDDAMLATGSLDGTFAVYQTSDFRAIRKWTDPKSSCRSLAWVGAKSLVSVGYNPRIEKWDLDSESPRCDFILAGSRMFFESVALDPGGSSAVAVGSIESHGVVYGLDIKNWKLIPPSFER